MKVKLSELIAPSFYALHNAVKENKYTHWWIKGGRGSTKSSWISIEIISGMMKNPNTNALAIRKVGMYLADSVYNQLIWAIDMLNVSEYWTVKKSPLELIYEPTGQRILFRGADKPKKLKSTKTSRGYFRYIWYEEVDEFNGIEEIRTINQSLMRGGDKYDVFYSYNPPKSQRNWVNNEVLNVSGDAYVSHTTYLTVPPQWLGQQFLIEAEHLKHTNEIAYRHEYLGEVTGTGGAVFANVTLRDITNDEMNEFTYIKRGLDWGYTTDPFAYVALNYDRKHKRIYIFYEYYAHGAKFDAIARAIKAENTYNHTVNAEREPRSNDELKDRGIRLCQVKKPPGSVEHGITWLQNLDEIIIDNKRCPNAAREFFNYELDSDNNGGFREGFPDRNNHTIDAVRYALEGDIGKRKAKVRSKNDYGLY